MHRDIPRELLPLHEGLHWVAEGLGWGRVKTKDRHTLAQKYIFPVNSQRTGRCRAEYLHLNRMPTDSFDSKHQMRFFSEVYFQIIDLLHSVFQTFMVQHTGCALR